MAFAAGADCCGAKGAKKKMLANMAEYNKAANEYQEKVEQAAEQEKPALIEVAPVEIPVTEDAPEEEKMWVAFEAYLNKTQAAALKVFFKANGIAYRPVKIKED